MLPSEMVILMSIALSENAGETLINRSIDAMSEYIDKLYESLIKRGYMARNSSNGYKLTPKGGEILLKIKLGKGVMNLYEDFLCQVFGLFEAPGELISQVKDSFGIGVNKHLPGSLVSFQTFFDHPNCLHVIHP